MANVNFSRGSQESYDSMALKNPDTVYICLDTGNIYLGEKILSSDNTEWETI